MSVSSDDNNLYALENQQHQQQRIAVQTLAAPIATGLTQRISFPTSFAGTIPHSVPPIKIKRKQVKNACVNCQKACKRCDDGRPCQRCIKYELTETCKSSIRKERKKGVKRGPYKRRNRKKDQDNKSTTSASSTCSDVPNVPFSYGQIGELSVNPVPVNLPSIPSQIFETQVTTFDGVGKFIIIPQSSEGTLYYILMPVQQQKQTSILPTRICASKDLTTDLVQVKVESELQSGGSDGLLLEEGYKLAADRGTNCEVTPNKEKDKSNLSVLSLVCSGLLNQDTVSYEQETVGNSSQDEDNEPLKSSIPKQYTNTSVSRNLEKQQDIAVESNRKNKILDSIKNKDVKENLEESPESMNINVTSGDNRDSDKNTTPRVYNWDYNTSSFQTPSVENPLLLSIPANTYPAQYMPIKHEFNICDMKCTRQQCEEFQLPQHSDSFSQNQIPMRQQYYEITPSTPHSTTNPSNAYMAQSQTSPFYQFTGQQLPQQITPTSLSFAFSPGISNNNIPKSQIRCYASLSASQNGSDESSQGQRIYLNYQI